MKQPARGLDANQVEAHLGRVSQAQLAVTALATALPRVAKVQRDRVLPSVRAFVQHTEALGAQLREWSARSGLPGQTVAALRQASDAARQVVQQAKAAVASPAQSGVAALSSSTQIAYLLSQATRLQGAAATSAVVHLRQELQRVLTEIARAQAQIAKLQAAASTMPVGPARDILLALVGVLQATVAAYQARARELEAQIAAAGG